MLKIKDSFIFFWRRPPPPLFIGGAEITQNNLAIALATAGAKVLYVGSLETPGYPSDEKEIYYRSCLTMNQGVNDIRDLSGRIEYKYKGIDCIAAPQEDVNDVLSEILLTHSGAYFISSQEKSDALVARAKENNFITIGWLHSASEIGMKVLEGDPDFSLSTSRYIASLAKEKFNTDSHVFYPSFSSCEQCADSHGEYITFINPVPAKGSDFFLEIARALPEREFLVVEGWYKNEEFLCRMPNNITYLPPQQDMRVIWSRTRLLLVPSKVEEAFGRVVVEASLNGIPSIVSSKGGLHEALNGSGMSLEYGNLECWVDAISNYDDPENYGDAKKAAVAASSIFKHDLVKSLQKIIRPSGGLGASFAPRPF